MDSTKQHSPDFLEQVTPAAEWKRREPRRIMDPTSPLRSPTPVIESTRYDLNTFEDRTLTQGCTSSSVLNLDDMSQSKVEFLPLPGYRKQELPITSSIAASKPSEDGLCSVAAEAKSRIPRLSRSAACSAPANTTYVRARDSTDDVVVDSSLAAYLRPTDALAVPLDSSLMADESTFCLNSVFSMQSLPRNLSAASADNDATTIVGGTTSTTTVSNTAATTYVSDRTSTAAVDNVTTDLDHTTTTNVNNATATNGNGTTTTNVNNTTATTNVNDTTAATNVANAATVNKSVSKAAVRVPTDIDLMEFSPSLIIDTKKLDELDSHSESTWSVTSELSEKSKPVYSDSDLKALMSGNIRAISNAFLQNSAAPPCSSAADIILQANMELINTRRRTDSIVSDAASSAALSKSTQSGTTLSGGEPDVPPLALATNAADSFFDVERSRPYDSSVMSLQAPAEAALTCQSGNLFNNSTGHSIVSLEDQMSPSRAMLSSPTEDSMCTNTIRQTVNQHLFEQDTSSEEMRPLAEPPRCHSLSGSAPFSSREMSECSSSSTAPPSSSPHHSLQITDAVSGTTSHCHLSTRKPDDRVPIVEASKLAHADQSTADSCRRVHSGVISPSAPSTHYLSIAERKDKPTSHSLPCEGKRDSAAVFLDSRRESSTEEEAKCAQVHDWLASQSSQSNALADITAGDAKPQVDTGAPFLQMSHNKNNSNSERHASIRVSPVVEESKFVGDELTSTRLMSAEDIQHCAVGDSHGDTTGMQSLVCDREQTTIHAPGTTLCQTLCEPPSLNASVKDVEVCDSLQIAGVHCTRSNINIDLPVTNNCDRWLELTVTLKEHRINGRISTTDVLFFKQGDNLIKPLAKDHLPIWINTAVAATHQLLVTLTVKGQELQYSSTIISIDLEDPRIELLDNSDGLIDFGALPYDSTRTVPLTLANKSRVAASLLLKVLQNVEGRAVVGLEAVRGSMPSAISRPAAVSKSASTQIKLSVPCESEKGDNLQTLFVTMKTPNCHGKAGSPEVLQGNISIYQSSAITREPLLVVRIKCLCGYASVQVPSKYHSFCMRCKPQSEATQVIPVCNGGDIPIDVTLSLSNSQHFSISPHHLSLCPAQQSSYRLTFHPRNITDCSSSIHCKVTATIEPDGKRCAIDVTGSVELPSAIPPHITKLTAGTQANLKCAPGNKMQLKCAPQVVKFGGVEINDRGYVTVKMLNYYEKPVKLHLDIDKSEFQIATLIDGLEHMNSSKEIILPVSVSSADSFNIRIAYEPRRTGLVQGRLKGQSLERGFTFRLPIYGYGGSSLIEPSIDNQPSPEVYSLSAGDVHSRPLYHHQMFLRNVGHLKGFAVMQCYSGPACTELLEPHRIQIAPSSLVVCPADARRLSIRLQLTEREKVLCENSKDVIATIKVTYVDQILRQLLLRRIAVHPQPSDRLLQPFLHSLSEDKAELEMAMPAEASSLSLFKANIKSFLVNIYGEPCRSRATISSSQLAVDSLLRTKRLHFTSPPAQSLHVSTQSLTFLTSSPGETQELTISLRNRTNTDVQVHFSKLYQPFKCMAKDSILKSKYKGMLRVRFTAECFGRWETSLTMSSSDTVVVVTLIGVCDNQK